MEISKINMKTNNKDSILKLCIGHPLQKFTQNFKIYKKDQEYWSQMASVLVQHNPWRLQLAALISQIWWREHLSSYSSQFSQGPAMHLGGSHGLVHAQVPQVVLNLTFCYKGLELSLPAQ